MLEESERYITDHNIYHGVSGFNNIFNYVDTLTKMQIARHKIYDVIKRGK